MKKVKQYIQTHGSMLAIGMAGDTNEIIRQSNIYYNSKVTNSDPIWLSDKFAYVLTTKETLMKGLEVLALFSLQQTRAAVRVIRGGKRVSMLPELARAKAFSRFERFIPEIFLSESVTRCAEPHCAFTEGGKKRFNIAAHKRAEWSFA